MPRLTEEQFTLVKRDCSVQGLQVEILPAACRPSQQSQYLRNRELTCRVIFIRLWVFQRTIKIFKTDKSSI